MTKKNSLIQVYKSPLFQIEMEIEADTIFNCVLGFMWIEFLWESYIGYRQQKIYKTKTTVPKEFEKILDAETFTKARLYALDKAFFGGIEGWFGQILSTCIIWFMGYKIFWDYASDSVKYFGYAAEESEISVSIIFSFYLSVFSTITGK